MLKQIFIVLSAFFLGLPVFGQQMELNNTYWLFEPPSGPDNHLIFKTNKVIYSLDFLNYYEGTWHLNEDTILISFTHYKGMRGIGNINPVSSTDYSSYTKSVPTINEINKSAKIVINRNELYFFWNVQNNPELFKPVDKPEFNPDNLKIIISGKCPEASIRVIPIEELKIYSKEELRLMRNEIFARYGYTFKSPQLADYFNRQTWYHQNPKTNEEVESYLTNIEIRNIESIRTIE
ncbi:YARHG domain-containing protein [Marivirga sp. S37H4]|uniref:YARHG domain-containing protein n=1 Tax=Marivirga aurantiaca TaxID=2802615 RepID=A0A935C536_9BACT|nr:YARHG domain-containing protein [Marivirga aurantiaca]MBK6263604.1 YARHG domain-containing protein [Marivirga aurantiaca]